MERDESTVPDDLQRPEGNSLLENYDKHDVGEREFVRRCARRDLTVREWGIDMRHDDGEDGIIYDDKMDFIVEDTDGNDVALVDVKTKSSPKWMGMFNLRHYKDYYEHAVEGGLPTFVIMFLVDGDDDAIYDEFVFEIGKHPKYNALLTSETCPVVGAFPDGNHAAIVKHEWRQPWREFERQVT